jgi:hypothetical protein
MRGAFDQWVAVFGRLFGTSLRTKQTDRGRAHSLPALFVLSLSRTRDPHCFPISTREDYGTANVIPPVSAATLHLM